MSNYRRLEYPQQRETRPVNYSMVPGPVHDIGYDVSLKGGSVETVYFASKKCHSQATEAVMKVRPGSIVLSVKLRR